MTVEPPYAPNRYSAEYRCAVCGNLRWLLLPETANVIVPQCHGNMKPTGLMTRDGGPEVA